MKLSFISYFLSFFFVPFIFFCKKVWTGGQVRKFLKKSINLLLLDNLVQPNPTQFMELNIMVKKQVQLGWVGPQGPNSGWVEVFSLGRTFGLSRPQPPNLKHSFFCAYLKVVSNGPVYNSILNSLRQRSQYISIKFPLKKQSENAWVSY